MNLLGWSVALCSGVAVTTSSVSGLISLWNPEFHATGWQLYCVYVSVAVSSGNVLHRGYPTIQLSFIIVLPLFFSGRWLPRILQATLAFSVTGFLILFCLVLALRQQAQPLSFLTESQVGTSGWNLGPAWIMGVGNSMFEKSVSSSQQSRFTDGEARYAFGSTDAVIHIAEEMKYPERDIPFTM